MDACITQTVHIHTHASVEANMLTTCTFKRTRTKTHRVAARVFKWSVGTHNETVLHKVPRCDDLLPVPYLAGFKCNMNQGPDRPLAHRSVTSQNAVY